jgi:predicted DNA-binding transcriptional regulator YafY
VDASADVIRWGIEQRLEFIEFRLFWEGGINRVDITEFFGVSVPQASKDLAQYRELEPANIEYDASEKRYLPTSKFKPRFLKPDPDRYLNQLRTIADRIMPAKETWLERAPQADAMPIPHRRVDAGVLRALLGAIRRSRSVEIRYQSMNVTRPEAIWRRITPHAFGHDGLRWHVRAFCHIDSGFKDFILSRTFDQRNEGTPGAHPSDDIVWSTYFTVVLKPNPKLGEGQQEAVAAEYGMKKKCVEVSLRKAMLYYFEKRMRLDIADSSVRPQEVPIVIANKKEFYAALKEAGSVSRLPKPHE